MAIAQRHQFVVPPTQRQMQLIQKATARNEPGAIIAGQVEVQRKLKLLNDAKKSGKKNSSTKKQFDFGDILGKLLSG